MNISRLYRYRTGNEFDLLSLENEQIWLTNPLYFNDPYDCAIQTNFSYMCERQVYYNLLERYGDRVTSDAIKEMAHVISEPFFLNSIDGKMPFEIEVNDILNNVAVACFSSQYDNISMWGYYSNSHKGFCLSYKVKDLIKVGHINSVVYKDNMDDIYDEIVMSNEKDTDLIGKLTLLKATTWKHEQEIRLIKFDNNYKEKQRGILINNIKPESIYLGAKMTLDDKIKIIKIAEKKGIDIYHLNMSEHQFQLYINEK